MERRRKKRVIEEPVETIPAPLAAVWERSQNKTQGGDHLHSGTPSALLSLIFPLLWLFFNNRMMGKYKGIRFMIWEVLEREGVCGDGWVKGVGRGWGGKGMNCNPLD